jgi:hypothetical protein
VTDLMQQTRGTAAAWASADPILEEGQLGVITDTGELVVGDGVTAFTGLTPIGAGGGGGGGGGVTHALTPETLHATYGDHFEGADLDTGKWTRAGSYVTADETVVDTTWLQVATARGAGHYYYQAAPAGDWTLVMKATGFAYATSMFGILAVDNSGNGVGAGPFWTDTAANNAPIVGNIAAGAYNSSGFQNALGPEGKLLLGGIPTWTKLVKSGTGWRVACSADGQRWGPLSPSHTNSTTITRIGFGAFFSTDVKRFEVDFFDVQ